MPEAPGPRDRAAQRRWLHGRAAPGRRRLGASTYDRILVMPTSTAPQADRREQPSPLARPPTRRRSARAGPLRWRAESEADPDAVSAAPATDECRYRRERTGVPVPAAESHVPAQASPARTQPAQAQPGAFGQPTAFGTPVQPGSQPPGDLVRPGRESGRQHQSRRRNSQHQCCSSPAWRRRRRDSAWRLRRRWSAHARDDSCSRRRSRSARAARSAAAPARRLEPHGTAVVQ